MRVVRIDRDNPDRRAIDEAATLVRQGRLVAFPTETVYGLGSNALDSSAIDRIFAAKGRPDYNPLIAHCLDLDCARALASVWPADAEALAAALWPGPLTLVVLKRSHIPDRLTAGLPTVAVRVPSHPVARALLAAADLPIAAPSANRFTELSPTTAAHVVKGLAGMVDLVLDAGPTPLGIESTVVDLSGSVPVLLRPGTISKEQLEEVLGIEIEVAGDIDGTTARPGPGMIERHYSPRARLVIVPGHPSHRLPDVADAAGVNGEKVGALLLRRSSVESVHEPVVMPPDAEAYGRELYAALHHLDDAGCQLIVVEEVPDDGHWSGIRDRLKRAAHDR